ncbi:SMAD/FHA domain-containing protein [Thalictrum thalictroides]|uniref:SMAD/FHA domain-containing protein n=1 Tax=Thalictrum thalictroides TaxID=46969 RepID=A0A7J6UT79_THATH|nr:SMAD/FHA domain-containing protein [Thalictrum thalictroides]
MAVDEDQEKSPFTTKPTASPKENAASQASSDPNNNDTSPAKTTLSPKDFILSVARKFSAQPLQNPDPGVWGVLTAISNNARKRSQGMNILLSGDEHCIGRLVEDKRFRIESTAVSGKHCKIYKKKSASQEVEQSPSFSTSIYLMDTSTNGTYLNWEKLNKNGSGTIIKHGDIVSFATVPQHENAFAFVYREVLHSTLPMDGGASKRKAGEFVSESKRLKGIGLGAPDGPISLDDVRSLQRSNKELRKQLESHVVTIETMRNDNRAAVAHHENELKELKETVSQSYLSEIKELRHKLELKQNELVQLNAISAERQQAVVDLNERLSASMQSRTEADEIITRYWLKAILLPSIDKASNDVCQKAIISEHERQLDEERNQRREEREKASADQKAALQRVYLEAQEDLKRQSDNSSRQERELKEVINKLQDSDKESRLLVETLRSKLEDTRESLVISEKKVRQLEAQVQEEQQVSVNFRKKLETLENEMKRLRKELESEKVAREEAWAKVSALELEMAAAIRDLAIEKRKFQGARERIILRETQLRSFYSTTEEISALFSKQQEQLKAMRRTLEDEENYDNLSIDIDDNATKENNNEAMVRTKQTTPQSNNIARESSAVSTPRVDRIQLESTSDEASVTEKHDCDLRNQEGHNTQDLECTSADHTVRGAFGSDIEGVGTATELEGDPIETECVLGTESPGHETNLGSRLIDLNRTTTFTGDTMQLDDDVQVHENAGTPNVYEDRARCSQSSNLHDTMTVVEDTEATGTIRTADLLTSEVAGSWAISTAPSVHGENDSPRSSDEDGTDNYDETTNALLSLSGSQAAGSQVAAGTTRLSQERQALNQMIEIMDPDFKKQFGGCVSSRGKEDENSDSDSDTQGDSDNGGDANGVDKVVRSMSDEDTNGGSDIGDDDAMDDCDDERQEDSLG